MLLKDLTTLTASLVSGTLFHVEKSGKAYNIDYTKLAKAIVEEYNGSTLGGSAQTIQAAIGALNSSLIYGGFGVNLTKSYKLIDHNAILADFTNPGWYRLGGNDFDDTMKSATDGTAFPMTQKDYYIQVIGTDFNNGIRYGILNVYTPRHDFFVTGRIWNNSVSHWEKAPLRSEFDALNNKLNVNVIYTDAQVTALGGINATIADAVAQKRFPENVPFSGMVQVNNRYHIDGYIYPGYAYGSIWMHRFDNDGLFVSIKAGVVSVSKLPTRSEFTALEARVSALEN